MDEPYVDPATLTDEELDKQISGEGVEDTSDEPEVQTPAEEKVEEKEEVAQEEEQEAPAEEPEETEEAPEEEGEKEAPKKPSRRESLRIQSLIAKMKETQEAPQAPAQPKKQVDYREMIDAPDEVYEKLNQTTEEYGQQQFQQGQSQSAEAGKSILFHTRLEIDAPKVESKFPQLDKSSKEFNPAVADAVNSWYLSMTGYDANTDTVKNPNIRYSDFAESFFELVDATAGEKNTQTQRNVVKQAATTGLRPDGSQAKRLNLNQAPSTMTDEELDAIINQAL